MQQELENIFLAYKGPDKGFSLIKFLIDRVTEKDLT